ncbi:MAG: HD domain-containing protein [Candidatus Babeliales bacterium]
MFENLIGRNLVQLAALFKDKSKYRIDDTLIEDVNRRPFYHRWNLLEHSMLVSHYCFTGCVCPAIGQREDLCKMLGLGGRLRDLLAIGGLLHDVGKAGDPAYKSGNAKIDRRNPFVRDSFGVRCISKENHEEIGFNYLTGKSKYYTFGGELFDFNALLDELKLTDKEKLVVAIIAGLHKELNDIYIKFAENCWKLQSHPENRSELSNVLLKRILTLTVSVGLTAQDLTDFKIVPMVFIIGIADLLAVFFEADGVVRLPILGEVGNPPARRLFSPEKTRSVRGTFDNEESARKDYCKLVLFEENGVIKNLVEALK